MDMLEFMGHSPHTSWDIHHICIFVVLSTKIMIITGAGTGLSTLGGQWYVSIKLLLYSFHQISLLSHLRKKKRVFLTFLAGQQSLKDRSSKDPKVRKGYIRSILDFSVSSDFQEPPTL